MQLKHIVTNSRKQAYFQFEQLRQKLVTQSPDIARQKNQLQQFSRQMQNKTQQFLYVKKMDLDSLQSQLELLNPQRTLERGYAIIMDSRGHLIQQTGQFTAPGSITVKLADGDVGLDIAGVQQKLI